MDEEQDWIDDDKMNHEATIEQRVTRNTGRYIKNIVYKITKCQPTK